MARTYFPALTSLRGIAAVGVILFHAQIFLPQFAAQVDSTVFALGYLWVDLFFILSGFVLAHRYAQDFVSGVSVACMWQFIVARFSKIYPAYFVALLALVLLEWGAQQAAVARLGESARRVFFVEGYSPGSLVSNVFLVQSWGLYDRLTWNIAGWSLSAEWAVYLVAPVLLWWLNHWRWATEWLVPAAVLIGLFAMQQFLGNGGLNLTYDFGVLRCVLEFSMGLALFRMYRMSFVRGLCSHDVSLWAVAVGLATAFFLGAADLLIVSLFALLILCGACGQGRTIQWLAWRPLVWLGTVSYSVYLVQWLVLRGLGLYLAIYEGSNLPSYFDAREVIWLVLVLVLVSVLLGAVLYAAVERPMHRRVQQWLGPKKRLLD